MMKSLLASVRSVGGLERVDHAVQVLEDEWRRHGDVSLERLWIEQKRLLDVDVGESTVLLAELVKTDLRCRFARGQTPTVAGYLGRFPELGAADSRVLSLIYEEFCLVEERGDRPDVDAFCERYPRWKDSLLSQLQYHHLFSQAAGVPPKATPFPEPGGCFEEFQLVSLLGRGGTSRVFLAKDLSLGGKQVVLKVSLDRGREPQAQGALDHPHIVPVNSVVFGDDSMRGLSMPYRRGLPLDEVIRRVNPASKPRRAIALWEALIREEGTTGSGSEAETRPPAEKWPTGPRGDGWEGFPARSRYAEGVAWVVKIVAEALHYAHGQQTFHRDVKPANVLLTIQHGPQLLDFNLAESPHSASQAQAAMHGGTLPYMAPEQIEAFLNPDLWGKVGARADVYSLGLVLREMLTGQAPDLPAQTLSPPRAMRVLLDRRPMLDVSVRRTNPAIPHALEAIVAGCLAVSLEDRYPDAGALAADLGRFLDRRPLVHAVNPSRRERCWNWGIRNRGRLMLGTAGLFLGVMFLVAGMIVERWWNRLWPSIPIQENPELFAAVSSLNGGRPDEGLAILGRLVVSYPNSSIPGIYRGLALQVGGHDSEAERYFGEAMNIAGARDEILAWIPNDPELRQRLKQFALQRFENADSLEKKKTLVEEERNKETRTQFVLANLAWRILVDDPTRPSPSRRDGPPDDSPRTWTEERAETDLTVYHLALTEQELGDYQSVVRRADEAIADLGGLENPDFATEGQIGRRLFVWRQLRSRALIMWAETLRNQGSGKGLESARERIQRAIEDLKVCSPFAESKNRSSLDLHYLQRIRVAASMARAEIELDLGHLSRARSALGRAREALQRYEDLARIVDRTRDLDAWYARLRTIEEHIRQKEGKTSSATPAIAGDLP